MTTYRCSVREPRLGGSHHLLTTVQSASFLQRRVTNSTFWFCLVHSFVKKMLAMVTTTMLDPALALITQWSCAQWVLETIPSASQRFNWAMHLASRRVAVAFNAPWWLTSSSPRLVRTPLTSLTSMSCHRIHFTMCNSSCIPLHPPWSTLRSQISGFMSAQSGWCGFSPLLQLFLLRGEVSWLVLFLLTLSSSRSAPLMTTLTS